MLTITLAALLATPDASACGGFFCQGPSQPIDQAAERILFAVDEDKGEVEVHVQIAYEGTAPDFAWVLPVPSDPELKLTSDDVFARLSPVTMPLWNLSFETEGECASTLSFGQEMSISGDAAADSDEAAPRDGGVEVLDSGKLGPYETLEVQADDADALLSFLQEKGYALPDDLLPKLTPYVAEGSVFVALRLQRDATVGELEPIALTYASKTPQIPLQLTAIAATPDMRLQPFVLGSARAVPDNYLHVQVNELAVDWMQQGSNYPDVITAAANQAGGQAFATDFSQSTDSLRGTFVPDGGYDLSGVSGTNQPAQRVVDGLSSGGISVSTGIVTYLRRALDQDEAAFDDWLDSQGITDSQYFQCPQCWGFGGEQWTLDADAVADELATLWLPAMEHAEDLLRKHDVMTRLTSSMSADEMTVDPTFVLNADMPRVDRNHGATLVTFCGKRRYTFDKAPRKLRLDDGRELWLPEDYWRNPSAFDYLGWIGDAGIPAEVVEQTGKEGMPVAVQDLRPEIDAALAALNDTTRSCGCDQRGGSLPAWLLALGAVVGLRRRRG